MADNKITDKGLTEIDKALQAAKQRQAIKQGMASADGTVPTSRPVIVAGPAKQKLTEADKQAKIDARNVEREERKVAKDAERAAKKAATIATTKPAHMRKVEKAAEKLPALGQAALLLFSEASTNLPQSELAGLANHILHFNRVQATERALGQKLSVGQTVLITESQDSRFLGKTGTIDKVQRIRCYVKVEGFNKPAYLFTSGVKVIEPEEGIQESPVAELPAIDEAATA